MWPAFPASDYYGSSATPRRQQRTVRLPQTPTGFGGHRRDASHVHHQPLGRAGVQLYPGGIAVQHRNTPHGLTRPTNNQADKTIPSNHEDRAPQQPIPASFGVAALSRGFNHWFGFPTPFCLATAPGSLAANRRSIVRGCSHPPPHLRHQAAPQLLPAVAATGGGSFHPTRLMAPRGAGLLCARRSRLSRTRARAGSRVASPVRRDPHAVRDGAAGRDVACGGGERFGGRRAGAGAPNLGGGSAR